jgi:hypothetical protein
MTIVYVEQRGIWHHVEREQDRDIVTACDIVVADGRPVELSIEPRPPLSRHRSAQLADPALSGSPPYTEMAVSTDLRTFPDAVCPPR